MDTIEPIDQFTALAAGGRTVTITMQEVPDDNTWFEVYASGQLIGKIHWRADTDGYMAQLPGGGGISSFAALSDAQDALLQAGGYYIAITTQEPSTHTEEDIPPVNERW